MELQAHGRTSDRNQDLSFEQDADDVAKLLANLKIDKADFFGFSNGGTTTLQIALRHPEIVDKIFIGSALAKRNGVPDGFWDFMQQAKLENMPEELKTAYKEVASALENLGQAFQTVVEAGIKTENIYFFGFSQGACLLLEYIGRNAQRYGGAAAIIGGLIGEELILANYKGDFEKTPVFIGTSHPDFHVPVERVHETERILTGMNADVYLKVYENAGHSINQDEIDRINKLVHKN